MEQDHIATDQDRIDEAAVESFPASDPPSWNAGLSHEQVHLSTDPSFTKPEWLGDWEQLKSKLKQKFANLTDEDLLLQDGKEDEFLLRLQKKLGKTRQEIEDLLTNR